MELAAETTQKRNNVIQAKMEPLITISIPVYNVAKYVEKALLSALNQTYDNLEILVVDDKGADNSMEIVRKIVATNARGKIVRIIEHEQNIGLGATRNTSIENAKGEYLFFMDSDDYISDNCIELLYKAIKKSNADMAVGSFAAVLADGSISERYINGNLIEEGECALGKWITSRKVYVQVWNKLYRTELLRKNNVICIPSNRNEDVFYTFQLIPVVKKVVFIPDITYFYLIENPDSTMYTLKTSLFDERTHIQYVEILEYMLKYMREHKMKNHKVLVDYFKWFYGIRIRYVLQNSHISRNLKIKYLNDIKNLNANKELGSFDKRPVSVLLGLMPTSFVESVYHFRSLIRKKYKQNPLYNA